MVSQLSESAKKSAHDRRLACLSPLAYAFLCRAGEFGASEWSLICEFSRLI